VKPLAQIELWLNLQNGARALLRLPRLSSMLNQLMLAQFYGKLYFLLRALSCDQNHIARMRVQASGMAHRQTTERSLQGAMGGISKALA
jgi:hypothetical protein